jgi:hypothetical protein
MFIGFVGFVLFVFQKILEGRGLEYYLTGYGVQFNYLGAAGVLIALSVAVLVGRALRYWTKHEERDFQLR